MNQDANCVDAQEHTWVRFNELRGTWQRRLKCAVLWQDVPEDIATGELKDGARLGATIPCLNAANTEFKEGLKNQMSREDLHRRLDYFNKSQDWSVFADVPENQQVDVSYPEYPHGYREAEVAAATDPRLDKTTTTQRRADVPQLKDFSMKFQPEMFPQGTRVQLTYDAEPPETVYVVDSVVRVAARKFIVVIHPGQNDAEDFSVEMEAIRAIVYRGDGPMRIQYDRPDVDVERACSLQMLYQGALGLFWQGRTASSKNYHFQTGVQLTEYLEYGFNNAGMEVVETALAGRALEQETFVKRISYVYAGKPSTYFSAPKKRVRAWFKANRNRFMVPLDFYEKRALGHTPPLTKMMEKYSLAGTV